MILLTKEVESSDLWIYAKNEDQTDLGFIWVSLMPHAILRLRNIHVYTKIYSDDNLDHQRKGVGTILLRESSEFGLANSRVQLTGQLKPTPYTEESKRVALLFYERYGISYLADMGDDNLRGRLSLIRNHCLEYLHSKKVLYRYM